ncbi:MAG TPA: Uma2 family endonuclease [Rhizobiaceae bacterium]|nr:Uma2 family endonuclease [Rhizobiaceae bacterium]
MAERVAKRMSVEEFFDWQERQDKNYELVDGVPVLSVKAMTGASGRHDMVTVNAIVSLGNSLRGKPCRPRTSDQSVRTFRGTRRPDVTIECAPPDTRRLDAADPRVVIEILSPSTMRFDRFQKLEEYKLNDCIRVILLVDTEAPQVTVWRRSDSGWRFEDLAGMESVIELPEIHAALRFSELYADIDWSKEEHGDG